MTPRALRQIWTVAARQARVARRRATGTFGAFVLMYHRVAEDEIDPWGLCVTPAHFAEHLAVLSRRACLLSLSELAAACGRGDLPRNAVAVTFDDGYADNLYAARPLLEEHGVPATVFLATGFAGHGRPFWWDVLAHAIVHAHPLPATIEIDLGGTTYHHSLGSAVHPDSPSSGGGVLARTPRHGFHRDLWRRLGGLPLEVRERALDDLAAWAGVGQEFPLPRALTRDEVLELGGSEWVDVGAHTVSHPPLPEVSPARQRDEIVASRSDVEALLGRPIHAFSYPHGRHAPETVALVREAGFGVACCSPDDSHTCDLSRQSPHPFLLPRVYVGDWDGPTFERRLRDGFER